MRTPAPGAAEQRGTAIANSRAATGFTLLEVVFVIILAGILARFAMMKLITPGTMTLPAQAQSVGALVRRAQGLAIERGQRMKVSAVNGVNGTVTISPCSSAGTCIADQTVTLDQGVVVGSTSAVYFNSLGQPVTSAASAAPAAAASAAFTLSYQTGAIPSTQTVTVEPLTGRVSVN